MNVDNVNEDDEKKRSHSKSKSKKRSRSNSSDSSSDNYRKKKRKEKKSHKHKHKKDKHKLKKCKNKEKYKESKREPAKDGTKSSKEEDDDNNFDVPINLMETTKSFTPMTKDEWEKRQSIVRRVYDETSGRDRLIKGDGEVIEEIVSKKRHQEINEQATKADANYFQSVMKMNNNS